MDHYYNRNCTLSVEWTPWLGVYDGPRFRLHSNVSAASVSRLLRVIAKADNVVLVPATRYLPAAITFRIDGTCPNT
jgi:hypothetical protein